jgi:hypothetical protein
VQFTTEADLDEITTRAADYRPVTDGHLGERSTTVALQAA